MSSRPRSYKHPILELVFKKKRNEKLPAEQQPVITFTVQDLRTAMTELGMSRKQQASMSNLVIDLTRKNRGIDSRVPQYISQRGYDLLNVKEYQGEKIAGLFRFVGIGNEARQWLVWPDKMETITIEGICIPNIVLQFIRRDEGALFSVIDYCDILSTVLSRHFSRNVRVVRVQHPLKWQPNEIDGLYASDGPLILYPVEGKALSTQDDINLSQMRGELETMRLNYGSVRICPIGCQMMSDGMRFAIFPVIEPNQEIPQDLVPRAFLRIVLQQPIDAWSQGKGMRGKSGLARDSRA